MSTPLLGIDLAKEELKHRSCAVMTVSSSHLWPKKSRDLALGTSPLSISDGDCAAGQQRPWSRVPLSLKSVVPHFERMAAEE